MLGGAKSAEALGDTLIIVPGNKSVRLNEIADVHDGIAERRSLARLNGRPATAFQLYKAKGVSDVSTAAGVAAELVKIQKDNPSLHIEQIFTTVQHTIKTYHSALEALIEGSILAVAVVWLFLRNWRATLISALAIPLSAIPTFAFMQWMGFTLNEITLLSLSLVAGVLVDDAIVEIENIVRHMRMGKSGFRAAMEAADEIGLAVVATSFTIIAVFLPVSFMGGVSGQFFKQFGLTVAAAVFISLMVARMITPVLAAYALNRDAIPHRDDGPIMTAYVGVLKWCVANRWKTISFGFLFFVLSVGGGMLLPKAFVPPEDFSTSILNIELPPGGKLEDTARISAAATAILRKQPEVTDVVEFVGTDSADVRQATVFVSMVPRSQRTASAKEFEQRLMPLLNQVPDAHISFQNFGFGGGRDITLYLVGDDPALTERTGHRLLDEMRGLKEIRSPRINGDMPRPEIVVHPRLDLAAQLGVSVQSISETIRIATLGDLPQNGAKFALSDRTIPIRVSLPERSRRDLTTLENLPVPTSAGASVPLKSVADISFGQGPSSVRRYNQSRRLYIDADLAPGVQLGTANEKVHALPALKNLPQGVRLVETGDTEFMNELIANFVIAVDGGCIDGAGGAGAAVCASLPTDHHSVGVAAVVGRRFLRTVPDQHAIFLAGDDRRTDADGHRGEEFHLAGGLRHRRNARRQDPPAGHCRGGTQARTAHCHDDRGHGGGYVARGLRHRRSQRFSTTHGHRGHRRLDHLDVVDAGDRAGRVHAV